MNEVIGSGGSMKYTIGNTEKKLPLSSIFIMMATKFADFFSDIYDAFIFEIKQRGETYG